MSAFEVLGLHEQADAVQIKRAYAKLLRSHRPDEDADAFQRLHDAYQACLQQARWREMGLDDDDYEDQDQDEVTGTAPTLDTIADTAAVALPPEIQPHIQPLVVHFQNDATYIADADASCIEDYFDAAAFTEELAARMRADTRQSVDRWLRSHEDLYSLERKQVLLHDVVELLGEIEPAHAARHFEHVTRFFGLDTVSGIEYWLQHRLDEIRLRLDDVASFDHLLHVHAAPNADWADHRLAEELTGPFHWLRRLFLIAFPGMPGRIGELARALHAADPVAAAAQLNAKATKFWQRATDRTALRAERLGFMAARLALWSTLIVAFLTLVEDDSKGLGRGFAVDVAAAFGIPFGLWLVYALAVVGLSRFRHYNQTRMQWDMSMVISLAGLACGVTAVAMGSSGVFVWIMTTIYWLRARHDGGDEGYTAAQAAAFLAGASGFALAFLLLRKLAPESMPMPYQACIAAVFAFGSQLVHDVILAKVRGISLRDARHSSGWLWPIFGAQAVLSVLLSIILG